MKTPVLLITTILGGLGAGTVNAQGNDIHLQWQSPDARSPIPRHLETSLRRWWRSFCVRAR